jgi:hypothetical protein
MISYELGLRLKEAGWPQEADIRNRVIYKDVHHSRSAFAVEPSLEELFEAIGNSRVEFIRHYTNWRVIWPAGSSEGDSLKEALIYCWLSFHE